jgi:tRNA (guanine26-N2/guanine27-N2)-dimethyltransferase
VSINSFQNLKDFTQSESKFACLSTWDVIFRAVKHVSVAVFTLFCSVIVLNAFAKEYKPESQTPWEAGTKYDDGIIILEALSATGLRSIRYAKEVKGVKEIVANDISVKAVDDIKRNISANAVEDLVTASHDDATCVWMNHKNKIVIVIF